MDGRTPETCWAVNKRQDNKQENCCIWLVIYLNWGLIRRRPRVTTTYSPLADGYQRFRGTLCFYIQGISWKAHIDNHLHGDLVSWPSRPQFLNLPPGGRRQYALSNRWFQPTRIKGIITQSTMKCVIFHVCFLSVFIYYIYEVTVRLSPQLRNRKTVPAFRISS
jgi:hypothetical protein